MLDKIYITKISGDFSCDVFFDGVPEKFELESKSESCNENNIEYNFCIYKKVD
jgi:dihydrofolate reductase